MHGLKYIAKEKRVLFSPNPIIVLGQKQHFHNKGLGPIIKARGLQWTEARIEGHQHEMPTSFFSRKVF